MRFAVPAVFERWTSQEIPSDSLRRFRVAFAAIWLTYDVLDVALGGTQGNLWARGEGAWRSQLLSLQLCLISAELLLLGGVWPRAAAFAAFGLRAIEAYAFFRLNDFYYFSVTALILSICRTGKGERSLVWTRDVLVWQTAWIYFATSLMKLNPNWLSGGHLYVRHQYVAARLAWPYPEIYLDWISGLGPNAALAIAAVAGELTLAVLLLAKAPRSVVGLLALALHAYAIVCLNVIFFSASMIAQVVIIGGRDPGRKGA